MPGVALNLNSTNLPRPWAPRESSPARKIPTAEPGIEPGTSWLVVGDSDHYPTSLVIYTLEFTYFLPKGIIVYKNYCAYSLIGDIFISYDG